MENILEQPTSIPAIGLVDPTLGFKTDNISSGLEDEAVTGPFNILATLDFEGHDPQSLLAIMKKRVDLTARFNGGVKRIPES